MGVGNGKYGSRNTFWMESKKDAKMVLNSRKDRGRVYDAISVYHQSESLLKFCDLFVKLAMRFDKKMPACKPTHLIIFYYEGDVKKKLFF